MAGRVHGRQQIMANLSRNMDKMRGRVGTGLRESMRNIADQADPLTPEKTGRMKRNKRVTLRKSGRGGGPQVSIRYREPYAGTQHERTDFKHETGRAKFLQLSVDRNKRTTLDTIKKRARFR